MQPHPERAHVGGLSSQDRGVSLLGQGTRGDMDLNPACRRGLSDAGMPRRNLLDTPLTPIAWEQSGPPQGPCTRSSSNRP